jgi:hypothetical protein
MKEASDAVGRICCWQRRYDRPLIRKTWGNTSWEPLHRSELTISFRRESPSHGAVELRVPGEPSLSASGGRHDVDIAVASESDLRPSGEKRGELAASGVCVRRRGCVPDRVAVQRPPA